MLWECCTQYASKFGKLTSGHRTGKGHFSFQCQRKQCQRMLTYRTIAFSSHASKVMLKFFQVKLQQYVNQELPDVQAGFRKGRGIRDQSANMVWSSKKQENFRKTSISALLTMPKPLTVWITTNWKIFQDMGITDHLTCLLRNLYAGQETTVRTGQGTTDWFQIGKGVHQYCHPASLIYMQSTSWEMLDWMNRKLESGLLGEISITWDMQITRHYGRKQRRAGEPLDESERGEWKSWLQSQHSEN